MSKLVDQLDDLLPQTQCGLCGYAAGCRPYAEAVLKGEALNLCVPGGQPVTDQIAQLLARPSLPVELSEVPLGPDQRPKRLKAHIIEDQCIGCTKCLVACPTDAIIGTGKMMHTVLQEDCTGCELCVAPCPVDCIEMRVDEFTPSVAEQKALATRYRQLYQRHLRRLSHTPEINTPLAKKRLVSISSPTVLTVVADHSAATQLPNVPLADTVLLQHPAYMLEIMTLKSKIGKLQRKKVLLDAKSEQRVALEQELITLTSALTQLVATHSKS